MLSQDLNEKVLCENQFCLMRIIFYGDPFEVLKLNLDLEYQVDYTHQKL